MKTGKITYIDSDGQWQNNYGTFNRYKVTMADGNVYRFNAKGEFKNNIGDEVVFQVTNTEMGNAKLMQPLEQQPSKPKVLTNSNGISVEGVTRGMICNLVWQGFVAGKYSEDQFDYWAEEIYKLYTRKYGN
jgi:hypothetical protein